MTILNTASDGFFNVLIVLHRTVSRYGPMDRKRLLTLCSADPDSDPRRLSQTLSRWIQLRLFQEMDGKIGLDKDHRNPEQLPALCRRILFREENNQNFWENEGTRSADFTRALAFLLTQDIYAQDFGTHATVQGLEQRQIRDEGRRALQNDVRWNGLRFWSRYLGLFWVDQRLWPDPTVALREDLPLIFGSDRELSAADFMRRLAEVLPVLDGGGYRVDVESALDPAEWHRPARADLLSTSLSRALWRLSRPGGSLGFEQRSDTADGRTLQRAGSRDWVRFTNVVFNKGGQ